MNRKIVYYLVCNLLISLSLVSCRTEKTELYDSSTGYYTQKIEFHSNYEYSFEEGTGLDQCSTGKQGFKNKEIMCAALQHDLFNDNCALDLREKYFHANCTGEFVEVSKFSPAEVQIKSTKMIDGGDPSYQIFISQIKDRSKTTNILPIVCGTDKNASPSNQTFLIQALNGTKLIIQRPVYGLELSKTDELKRYKEYRCDSNFSIEDDNYDIVELASNDSITFTKSIENPIEYIFSCNKDEQEILTQEKKDFNLLVGSSVILNEKFSQSRSRKILLKCIDN